MNIWSIIVVCGLVVIVYYCIVSNREHWKQIELQATLLMMASEKKANGDEERWIPMSQMSQLPIDEDSEDEMEEQDFLDIAI